MQKLGVFLFLSIFLSISFSLKAQDTLSITPHKIVIGAGVGYDYGGIGVNASYYPIKQLGLFGGVGFASAGFAYNVGAKIRFVETPKSWFTPYFMAMYGYNSKVLVILETEHNKLFYGPTLGAGVDVFLKSNNKVYWSFAITFPIEPAEKGDYMSYLVRKHDVEFRNEFSLIGISLGVRLVI